MLCGTTLFGQRSYKAVKFPNGQVGGLISCFEYTMLWYQAALWYDNTIFIYKNFSTVTNYNNEVAWLWVQLYIIKALFFTVMNLNNTGVQSN